MSGTFWAGLAAILTGVAGILTAWAAVVRARNEGRQHCRDELAEARGEAERVSAELHALRMREQGQAALLLVVACALFVGSIACTAVAVRSTAHDGARGVAGPPGPAGKDSTVPGPQGPPGKDSTVPGPPGPQGVQGVAGRDSNVPGPTGAQGEQGQAGQDSTVPGPTGAVGAQGVPGPTCPPNSEQVVLGVHERTPFDQTRTLVACAVPTANPTP